MPKLNEAPVEVPGTKKLTGTFTFPPPLCIGEPFVEANKRGGKDERSKGKQLIGGPMRGTVAFPGNFSTIPFLYVVCHNSLNNLHKAINVLQRPTFHSRPLMFSSQMQRWQTAVSREQQVQGHLQRQGRQEKTWFLDQ
jgi:hypothetical protein